MKLTEKGLACGKQTPSGSARRGCWNVNHYNNKEQRTLNWIYTNYWPIVNSLKKELLSSLLTCDIYLLKAFFASSEYKINCFFCTNLSLHLGTVRLTEAIILAWAGRQDLACV